MIEGVFFDSCIECINPDHYLINSLFTNSNNISNISSVNTNEMISGINFLLAIKFVFIFSGIIIVSGWISITVVGFFVYDQMNKIFELHYNKNKNLYDYDTFLFEYLDEYNNLIKYDLNQDDLVKLKNRFIKYTTPRGEIIMHYDESNQAFNYYCLKAITIPFIYLDVVSRIYVVKYNCKKIYLDNHENVNDENKNDENKNDENKNDVNNIFYSSNKQNSSNRQNITNYYSNKYKYKGTITEFMEKCKQRKLNFYDSISESNDLIDIKYIISSTVTDVSLVSDMSNVIHEKDKMILFYLSNSYNSFSNLSDDDDFDKTISSPDISMNNSYLSFSIFKNMT